MGGIRRFERSVSKYRAMKAPLPIEKGMGLWDKVALVGGIVLAAACFVAWWLW